MDKPETIIPRDPVGFDNFLACYDWFYDFSDDHRVWTQGLANEKELLAFLASSEATDEHKKIYNKHHEKQFNRDLFVSKNRPYKVPFPEQKFSS